MRADLAKVNFLRWLSQASPSLYASAINRARITRNDLGDIAGWIDTAVSAVVAIGGGLLAKKQQDAQLDLQKKTIAANAQATANAQAQALQLALIDANTKRAAAGLPPVDLNGNVIPGSALPNPVELQGQTGAALESISPVYVGIGVTALALLLIFRKKVFS